MKKILAIALVAVFVLGMAVTAFAEGSDVTLSGAYRLRAINTNTDGDDDTGSHDAYYNQRLRLQMTAKVGDDVTVVTRGDIAEGIWDGKSQTDSANGHFDVDHAYMTMSKFGLSFTVGLQEASWGNKFWSWANTAERIKVVKKLDALTVGAFTQKDNEVTVDGAGDIDSNSVFVIVPFGEGDVRVIYVVKADHDSDLDGNVIDIALKNKFGAIGVTAEFVQMSGDLFETAGYATGDGENPTGMFVAVDMDVTDSINVGLAYASTANGFVADDDFGPTLLFGPSANATGIMRFGQGTQAADYGDTDAAKAAGEAAYDAFVIGTGADIALAQAAYDTAYKASIAADKAAAAGDDTSSAIVLSAKMKVSDDMNAGANFAMATISDESEVDMNEIDLWMDYKLATNTTFWAGYAYGMPDGYTAADDPITSAAFQIETKF